MSKSLDRVFTEWKNFHNCWKDSHFSLVDFYGKALYVFLAESDRFMFLKAFLNVRFKCRFLVVLVFKFSEEVVLILIGYVALKITPFIYIYIYIRKIFKFL